MGKKIGSFSTPFVAMAITISGLFFFKVETKTHWRDIQVLKDFKAELDPDSVSHGSCVGTWDFSADPCESLFSERFTCGFRCDDSDESGASRLTELALDQAGYSGSLANLSLDLPYLQTLDLSNNRFTDSVPDSLAGLSRLRRMVLSGNAFSGEIPPSVGALPALEELYLDGNRLSGKIPKLSQLVSLKRLDLQSNSLSGGFPDLNQLERLAFVDLSNNNLSGELPETLPVSLVELSLRNNSFRGRAPSFERSPLLQVLDLSRNLFGDSVSSGLFTHESLQQLTLSFNRFTAIESPIHHELAQSQLIALDINDNKIGGFLPSFLALMPRLSALSLENNQFTGMIPVQYAIKTAFPGSGVEPFERLLLGRNYLFGPIPGPLLRLRPGSAHIELTGNCLIRCPEVFFFCQGGDQKSLAECRAFGPIIP